MRKEPARRSIRGAIIIEFLISILFWLLVILFAIDLARIGFYQVKLELALRRVTLWGAFGQLYGAQTTRVGSLKQMLADEAVNWQVPVNLANVKVCPGYNTTCTTEGAGAPGDYFTVSVTGQQLPVMFPAFWWSVMSTNGINAKATAQNEYMY